MSAPLYAALVRYGQMLHVAEFVTAHADLSRGERCVIRTERGTEVGTLLTPPRLVPAPPVPPPEGEGAAEDRREILRRVGEQDAKKLRLLDREGRTREFGFCQAAIAERGLPMKLARVEHLLGGDKIVFYFTSEQRVDFRGLVKDLAAEFNSKIVMHQIGARDEARLLGDFNSCGQQLCCQTFIKEFDPITMKMAKNQMTTLDPAKITGRCGRLMCCLRYEDDNYVEARKGLPRKGQKVRTRDGVGVVVGQDVIAQRVTVDRDGRRSVYAAQDVLPVDVAAAWTSGPARPVYVTVPPLWQGELPDATRACSLLAADIIARWARLAGADVHFPVTIARYPEAIQSGRRRRGPVGEFSGRIARVLESLAVRCDLVFRTDDAAHVRTVTDFCRRLEKVGDLYPQEFSGWQCQRCHLTLQRRGVERERCLYCGSALEKIEGRCWFFKLSRFQRKLLATIQTRDDAIRPHVLKLALEGQIKRGLEDMVVARDSFDRGLPVPSDPAYRLAGWFESLLSYVSCLIDQDKNPRFYRYWPAQFQILDPKLLWAHGVVWLAMLLASEVDLPEHLIVHGEWSPEAAASPADVPAAPTPEGGPSHAGGEPPRAAPEGAEVADPGLVEPAYVALAAEYGGDSLRYFLFREVPFGLAGQLDRDRFLETVAHDLGRDLGLLMRRVTSLVESHFEGAVPAPAPGEPPDRRLAELLQAVGQEAAAGMERLQFSQVLEALHSSWRTLAGYLEEVKPWKLVKSDQSRAELSGVVYNICETIRILAVHAWPILPVTAEAMLRRLGIEPRWEDRAALLRWGGTPPGSRIDSSVQLFPHDDLCGLSVPAPRRGAGDTRISQRRSRR